MFDVAVSSSINGIIEPFLKKIFYNPPKNTTNNNLIAIQIVVIRDT